MVPPVGLGCVDGDHLAAAGLPRFHGPAVRRGRPVVEARHARSAPAVSMRRPARPPVGDRRRSFSSPASLGTPALAAGGELDRQAPAMFA